MTIWAGSILHLALFTNVAHAALTVGPGGSHTTIQSAIDAAVASGVDVEIRVASGTWHEHFRVPTITRTVTLTLTGGWDTGFVSRPGDRAHESIIDSDGYAPVIESQQSQGTMAIETFTITGAGHAVPATGIGGAILADLRGAASLVMRRNHITSNHVVVDENFSVAAIQIFTDENATVLLQENVISDNTVTGPSVSGGALFVVQTGKSRFTFMNNEVLRNTTKSTADAASGNEVFATDFSQVTIVGNQFLRNVVKARGEARDAGLAMHVQNSAVGVLNDNSFDRNQVASSTTYATGILAIGAEVFAGVGRPRIEARRNVVRNSAISSPNAPELEIYARAGDVNFTDNWVVDGTGTAVFANAELGGKIYLTNDTIFDHKAGGVDATSSPPDSVYLSNSIVYKSLPALRGSISTAANLINVNPFFVAISLGNYHLGLRSPAIDAGLPTPPGGLGAFDIDGEPRLRGHQIDIGADETAPR